MRKGKIHIEKKKVLFVAVIMLLFIPMFQQHFQLLEERELKGSFESFERQQLTVSAWFEGSYQKKQQDYINQNIGFRNSLVRLYNQIHYSFYNYARANGVVVGKENYLYEKNYITAHLGRDFIGEEEVEEKTRKLQEVSDTLQANGVDLIVLLAPGKGSYYEEFIPEKFAPELKTRTNLQAYREALSESRIHCIDMNAWFLDMKDTSQYPLFPKTGIHWSKYGEALAADSIISYVSELRDIHIPNLNIESIMSSKKASSADEDIEEGMNLLFQIEDLEMGYPVFKIEKDSSQVAPKLLSVADSYYWGMYNWGFSSQVFRDGSFWYYSRNIYPESTTEPNKVEDIDILSKTLEYDVVLLISTDANLYKFAFGFIDQMHEAIHQIPD